MSNKTIVTTIIIIILFIVIIGTTIFQQFCSTVQEGFQGGPIVATRNGKKIKRKRTLENMQEGIDWDPLGAGDAFKKAGDDAADWFNKLGNQMKDGFDKVKDGFNKMADWFTAIGDFFNEINNFFQRVFSNIGGFLTRVFKVIGCNIKCAVNFIANLNNCFGWYFLDVIGKTLYLPIGFIFWLFNLQKIENMIWDYIEEIDCIFKNLTGFHLIHYSDSINKKCYSCCCDDFPNIYDYDWSFHFKFERLTG
jgi:hypothetical protein